MFDMMEFTSIYMRFVKNKFKCNFFKTGHGVKLPKRTHILEMVVAKKVKFSQVFHTSMIRSNAENFKKI